jgi:3-carboxy-cis,cis-muconate cycloisomerase
VTPEIELFGSLYGTDAMRTIFSARERLRAMASVEAALARAQARLGLVPQEAAAAIARAVAEVDQIDLSEIASKTAHVGYSVVPLVAALTSRAGTDAARYLHLGATTQDILDTARVLQIRDALTLLEDDLRGTIDALAVLARRHRDDVMAGRTHLQHALPITFGYKVAVWLAPLLASLAAYSAISARVLQVQFGGAVGTLASLGEGARLVPVTLAMELDLDVPDAPWHADRSAFAAVASEVALTCGSLAKIATDVILLMQTEVGEVFEPYESGRGGSSTMPQKRNPIASEYILACTRGVHALLPMMLAAMAGDHERATGPWQSEEIALPQILVLASGAFAQARALAEGMTVDTARMRANLNLTGGLIMSEAVATALTPAIGKAEAHHLIEHACEAAIADARPLIDVLAEDAKVTKHITRDQLHELFRPESSIGEAGAVVDRVLLRYRVMPAR